MAFGYQFKKYVNTHFTGSCKKYLLSNQWVETTITIHNYSEYKYLNTFQKYIYLDCILY